MAGRVTAGERKGKATDPRDGSLGRSFCRDTPSAGLVVDHYRRAVGGEVPEVGRIARAHADAAVAGVVVAE